MKSLGIDPGSRTGIAVLDLDTGEYEIVETIDRKRARARIQTIIEADTEIRIVGIEYQERTHIYERPGVSVFGHMKIAQNVEKNRQAARDLLSLEPMYPWIKFYPMDPKKIGLRTKLSKELIESIYGYPADQRTSSHSRDAIMLARAAAVLWDWEKQLEEAEGKTVQAG